MKKKLKTFLISLLLLPQLLCFSGCIDLSKIGNLFSNNQNNNEKENVNNDESDDNTSKDIIDDYEYAGLSEKEWNEITANLTGSKLENISFETKNATAQGSRNKGLLAKFSNANEQEFDALISYLKTNKSIKYDFNNTENVNLVNTYQNTKSFLGYDLNKKYEYLVVLFNKEEYLSSNPNTKQGTLYISIMECVSSQNMPPIKFSQNCLTINEKETFLLNDFFFPENTLIKQHNKEITENKYGNNIQVEVKLEGNNSHYDQIIKNVFDLGYNQDENKNTYYNYKNDKLSTTTSFSAYKFVDNIEYRVYVYINALTGINFKINYRTHKKEEDKRKTWLTQEEKQTYNIKIDTNTIFPSFGKQEDVEQYDFIANFLTFYFVNVTEEQVIEYCKEKIFKTLNANISYTDEETILTDFNMTKNDSLVTKYQAIYEKNNQYTYSIEVTFHKSSHNIWIGSTYTYLVNANSMTITFERMPKL